VARNLGEHAGRWDGAVAGGDGPALVCFSHLRWDWVWQRPQHLLSRFAERHGARVCVVEEPEFVAGNGVGDVRVVERDGVTIVTPLLPAPAEPTWGFNEVTNPAIRALLGPLFAELGVIGRVREAAPDVIAWYYTPMALGAEPAGFAPALVVYDAMDELASFRGAPRALREREAVLMARADLVFAGGPSLYEARKGRHPRVSCFPSGVDPAHFARAAGSDRPVDLAARRRPVLGFYGVLDERLDLDLVAAVAEARPEWTLTMIGPLAKIAAGDLPRRSNIVYLGKRDYAELPGYLACFDVAVLPFARNEATRFISPTKTLEYMAGGKPIVSTPIKDIVDLYGAVVAFGETSDEFVAAVERALAEPPAERIRRLTVAQRLLAQHTWDAIADGMWGLMTQALAEQSKAEDRLQRVPRSGTGPFPAAPIVGVTGIRQVGRPSALGAVGFELAHQIESPTTSKP